MLVSTFASSSLFTIIISFVIFLVGHFHKMMTDFWVVEQQGGWVTEKLSKILVVVIPDFQIFNISDSVSAGQTVPLPLMGEMAALTLMYIVILTIAAWFLILDKEF